LLTAAALLQGIRATLISKYEFEEPWNTSVLRQRGDEIDEILEEERRQRADLEAEGVFLDLQEALHISDVSMRFPPSHLYSRIKWRANRWRCRIVLTGSLKRDIEYRALPVFLSCCLLSLSAVYYVVLKGSSGSPAIYFSIERPLLLR